MNLKIEACFTWCRSTGTLLSLVWQAVPNIMWLLYWNLYPSFNKCCIKCLFNFWCWTFGSLKHLSITAFAFTFLPLPVLETFKNLECLVFRFQLPGGCRWRWQRGRRGGGRGLWRQGQDQLLTFDAKARLFYDCFKWTSFIFTSSCFFSHFRECSGSSLFQILPTERWDCKPALLKWQSSNLLKMSMSTKCQRTSNSLPLRQCHLPWSSFFALEIRLMLSKGRNKILVFFQIIIFPVYPKSYFTWL